MRRGIGKSVLAVSVVLLLVFVVGCGLLKGNKDNEPNNSIEQAIAVKSGAPFNMKIDPKGDRDWYKIEVPEQGYLRITATGVPEGIKPEAAFALYQEWEGKKEKWIQDWKKIPCAVATTKPGTYYFAVKDDYDDAFSKTSFQVKVEFLKEFDSLEPNNDPKEAAELNFDTIYKPAIFPQGDNDWFKVKVQKPGYISVMAKNVPEGIKPEVRYFVYDEWAKPKTTVIRDWSKLPDSCQVSEPGEYYIMLHDDYDDEASINPMDLKIEFIDQMDVGEPNDDFKKAKAIKAGETLKIAIFPRKDKDYYKFKAVTDSVSFASKDVPDGIKPEARLYTVDPKNADRLKEAGPWGKLPTKFQVKPGTEYYVLFHDDYDDAFSEKTFEIMMK